MFPRNPTAKAPAKKVLIVHASPLLRLGILTALGSIKTLRISAETNSASEALDLFNRHRPQVVILGLTLRHGDGVCLIRDLIRLDPAALVLVVSNRSDALSVQRSFRAGARGYLMLQDDLAELARALEQIFEGELYASPGIAGVFLQVMANGASVPVTTEARLSDRELQIFHMIGRGFGPTRVARELRLSIKTIETHRMRIRQKLGVENGSELNRRAESWVLDQIRKRGRTR
jgi:DNA-binding NarL/FixJ family response regulator